MATIALAAAAGSSDNLLQQATALAQELNLPWCDSLDQASSGYHFVLILSVDGLALQQTGPGAPGPLMVRFDSGRQSWRQRHGGGKGQLIARAVGAHRGATPQVLDATAGLGSDAFVLAGLGCRVDMLEQSSVVAALLRDGLFRLAQSSDPQLRAIAGRMTLHSPMAAQSWLLQSDGVDLIYLDPMFPDASGSAAVKKEMQLFRQLLDEGCDEAGLLRLALVKARYRVVVKRHKRSPSIEGPAPSYQLRGKSTRYDIYSLKKFY